MRPYALILLLLTQSLFAQDIKDTELETKIKGVTVFLEGAQISREGKIQLQKGKSILVVKDLSPYLDEKSLEVKGEGDFTILSVNHKFNYLNEKKANEEIDNLRDRADSLNLEIAYKNAELEVLAEKIKLLDANKSLGHKDTGANLNQLREAVQYYEQEISQIKRREIQIKQEILGIDKEFVKLEKELKVLNEEPDMPSSEIEITVAAEAKTEGSFFLKYLVSNAGWYPKYDVRVESVEKPVQLTYKAEVFQQCGEDWEQVKLRFSNVNPNKSGLAPLLKSWKLTYERYTSPSDLALWKSSDGNVRGTVLGPDGEPLEGASILVKGTTTGMFTNSEGDFSLVIPNGAKTLVVTYVGYRKQEIPIDKDYLPVSMARSDLTLDEVVVTGLGVKKEKKAIGYSVSTIGSSELGPANQAGYGGGGSYEGKLFDFGKRKRFRAIRAQDFEKEEERRSKPLATSVIENQTSVEFEVKVPYTIKSDGEKRSIDLQTLPIDVIYEYKAIPKLDKDAFLLARLINWDQKQLLVGEANLYMEGTFVGRSILEANVLSDTLDLSLGRDKSIVIGREEIKDYKKRRSIGNSQIETRAFKVIVKNKRSETINLSLYDQIPVSMLNQIDVKAKNISGAKYDEDTGELVWEISLEPLEQKEFILEYEVKYPKRERVYLE
ncbi:MAG: mucoidy inhibitor MuiA family protein [Bacteroidia bacterium]|nr:mucoidy inhibitor MuiA family protein [Bacteroidia bacterium]